MKYNTVNGACTHPKSIRFGGRRRQCKLCHKTWTVRAKKRGVKPRKHRLQELTKTFVEKLTLVQQARHTKVGVNALAKRHALTLASMCSQEWPHEPPRKKLNYLAPPQRSICCLPETEGKVMH